MTTMYVLTATSGGEYEYDTYVLGVYASEAEALAAYERVAADFDGYEVSPLRMGAPAMSMSDLLAD